MFLYFKFLKHVYVQNHDILCIKTQINKLYNYTSLFLAAHFHSNDSNARLTCATPSNAFVINNITVTSSTRVRDLALIQLLQPIQVTRVRFY